MVPFTVAILRYAVDVDSGAAGEPEEIVLKKQVIAAQERLARLPEGPERTALLAEIARLQMRQAIAEEARRRFMRD